MSEEYKMDENALYWLLSYEAKCGRELEVKHLADIMGIKQGAARMQVYRAKSKMHAKGVTIDGVDLAQAAAVAEKTGAAGNRVKGASKRKAKQDDDDADEMSP